MPKIKIWKDSAWQVVDAKNGDTVDGLHFRINGGKLQYSTNGTTWTDAGTDTSDATALASDILLGKTVYVNGVKITGTIPSKTAQTFTPSTSNQTITAGQYLSGTQTISGSASLISSNIKAGANIFGVTGATNVIDTTTGSGATAAQILSGRVGYANGAAVTGNIASKTAQTFTPGTTNQTIAAGQYLSGIQTISGSSNLTAANIKSGVNVFGVVGTASSQVIEGSIVMTNILNNPSTTRISRTGSGVLLGLSKITVGSTSVTCHIIADGVKVSEVVLGSSASSQLLIPYNSSLVVATGSTDDCFNAFFLLGSKDLTAGTLAYNRVGYNYGILTEVLTASVTGKGILQLVRSYGETRITIDGTSVADLRVALNSDATSMRFNNSVTLHTSTGTGGLSYRLL